MQGRNSIPTTIEQREVRIESDLARALWTRLRGDGVPELLGHAALSSMVAVLLWDRESGALLVGWVGAVVLVSSFRAFGMRIVERMTNAEKQLLIAHRASVLALGLAWGAGSALMMFLQPLHSVAVLLAVLAGLLALTQVSFAADPPSFYRFLAGVVGPLPLGLLAAATDSQHIVISLGVVIFAGTLLLLHRRAHADLVTHLRRTALLSAREEEAERRGDYLSGLLRNAPIAIAVVDRDLHIQSVNAQFEALFGYASHEALGREVIELLVPEQRVAEARGLTDRVLQGEIVRAEVERRTKDGRDLQIHLSASAVPGSALGEVLIMYEDVSDQKRAERALVASEARLRRVIDSNLLGIGFGDAGGVVTDANDEYLRIAGYSRAELEAGEVNFLKMTLPGAVEALAFESVAAGGTSPLWEKDITRRDGKVVPVVVGLAALDQHGEQGVAFMLDITERKGAEEKMREARDLAERAAQSTSMFLANMSHEIRTPMNAVLGMIELTLDTDLTADQRRSLDVVKSSAESLLGILNDILDYSKIEADHLEIESISFDLPRLLHSVTSLLAIRAREKHLELIADVAVDLPNVVCGDPTRLRQVLTNLIGNAVKFTEVGEVVLSVRSESLPDGRAGARFAVRDTGIGIPKDKMEHVFGHFTQADSSMSRRYGGTGLGLAIVKRLASLMHGTLEVTSEVGRGSEFVFTIPLPVDSAPVVQQPDLGVSLAGQRVLVVDDNTTNRRILLEMLGAEGAHVSEVSSAAAGLAALRTAREAGTAFAIAIVDVQMPGGDGFGLASIIRADASLHGTRILMLTSAGQRGDSARCLELALDGYLTKPVSRSELVESVRAILSGHGDAGPDRQLLTRHRLNETRKVRRVLLAEDVAINREVACTMLRRRGHHVNLATNGREAVELASRSRYDVILMDIQMPEMDGFEATAAIRAFEKGGDVPIVALTAHALAGERERCIAGGMNGHVAKPFKPHELFAAVEGWESSARQSTGATATPRSTAAVDLNALRAQLREANSEDALDAIVDTFLETVPEKVAALHELLINGRQTDVSRAAHALKSSVGAIGAQPLAELLAQIEASAQSESLAHRPALAERVREGANTVLHDLRAYRQGVPA